MSVGQLAEKPLTTNNVSATHNPCRYIPLEGMTSSLNLYGEGFPFT